MGTVKKVVNDVMTWLNQRYGIALPVLPLKGWTQAVISLWSKSVDWEPGSSPEPTSIKVDGDWKPFGTGKFTVNNITIEIKEKK